MVGRETIARSVYHIQPIWSTSHAEARTRVIKLYKSWFREIPYIGNIYQFNYVLFDCFFGILIKIVGFFFELFFSVDDYNLPLTVHQCRNKLHTEFYKQKNLNDIRQIDTLVMKHQQELCKLRCRQMDRTHLLNSLANDSINGSENTLHRTQFLAKFLVGQN